MIYWSDNIGDCYLYHIFQGAYTGVCSQAHVPSYKNNIDKLKAKGVDSVICVSVNDPYALNGWAEKLQAKDAVSYHSICLNSKKCIKHAVCFANLIIFTNYAWYINIHLCVWWTLSIIQMLNAIVFSPCLSTL